MTAYEHVWPAVPLNVKVVVLASIVKAQATAVAAVACESEAMQT